MKKIPGLSEKESAFVFENEHKPLVEIGAAKWNKTLRLLQKSLDYIIRPKHGLRKMMGGAFIFLCCALSASAQQCPPNLICLTQEQANIAAQNARELEAQKEKVKVLEESLKAKDDTIAELKTVNQQNVADLKEAIRRTELELSRTNGMLSAREAEVVRQSQIITAMIPMLRKKKVGLINIF